MRGDTDFTHTAHLDRWDAQGTKFILGMDAHVKVRGLAEELPAKAWRTLERAPKYEISSERRARPVNVKEQIVKERGYKNIVLEGKISRSSPINPANAKEATAWSWRART